MNRDNMKQMAIISLFWGAMWGIAEATVGYLAHLVFVLPGIAGFIMFPIGFYFMVRAYKSSGRIGVLFSTAVVASTIKMIDLFLPGLTPLKTINPAICILMETAIVIAVIKVFNIKPSEFRWSHILGVSAGWRLGFMFYSIVLFAFALSSEFVLMGINQILRFIILESVINTFIIALYIQGVKVQSRERRRAFRIRPAYALVALVVAVLVKIGLGII